MTIGALSMMAGSAIAHSALQRPQPMVRPGETAAELRAKTLNGLKDVGTHAPKSGSQQANGLQQGKKPETHTYSQHAKATSVQISAEARAMAAKLAQQNASEGLTYGKPKAIR